MENQTSNIQVFVRVKPSDKRCFKPITVSEKILAIKERPKDKSYKKFLFEKIFDSNVTQEAVFNYVMSPLIEDVLQGYSCTAFAYGPSGTGKTYTIQGHGTCVDTSLDKDLNAGFIPRSLESIFDGLNSLGTEYAVRVSFFGIYNEELNDLLSKKDESKLKLMDDTMNKGGVIVHGLENVIVLDKKCALEIFYRGCAKQRRIYLVNSSSSRAHAIFTITVHFKSSNCFGENNVQVGRLNLVDLASTENNVESFNSLRDIGRNNQSLLTLGRVIMSLNDNTNHVPYRESKLTRFLQDSLGGSTKTCIVATVSPDFPDIDDTLSTLNLMSKAKTIVNKPIGNKILLPVDIMAYSEEISRLQQELEACRGSEGFYISAKGYSELIEKVTSLTEEKKIIIEQLNNFTDEYNRKKEIFRMLNVQFAEEAVADIDKLHRKNEQLLNILERNRNTMSAFQQSMCHVINNNVSETEDFVGKSIQFSGKMVKTVKSYANNCQNKILSDLDDLDSSIAKQCEDMMKGFNDEKKLIIDSYEAKICNIENKFRNYFTAVLQRRTEASEMYSSVKSKFTTVSKLYDDLLKFCQEQENKYKIGNNALMKKVEYYEKLVESMKIKYTSDSKNLRDKLDILKENNCKIQMNLKNDSLSEQFNKNCSHQSDIFKQNNDDFIFHDNIKKLEKSQQSLALKFEEVRQQLHSSKINSCSILKNLTSDYNNLNENMKVYRSNIDSNCISILEDGVAKGKANLLTTVKMLEEGINNIASQMELINKGYTDLLFSIGYYQTQSNDVKDNLLSNIDETIKEISFENTRIISQNETLKESLKKFTYNELEHYTPTGETPKRQDYNYQQKFKCSTPQEQLREIFRRQNILNFSEEQ